MDIHPPVKKPCKLCKQMLVARQSEKSDEWLVDCDECSQTSVYSTKSKPEPSSDYNESWDDLHPPRPTGYEKQWNRPW